MRGPFLGVVLAAALAVAGCSAPTAADEAREQLPDLSGFGLASFECGTGRALGSDFTPPSDDTYVAQCWAGSATSGIDTLADDVQREVLAATGGEDVSAEACARDASSGSASVACRAVLVTKVDTRVLVRTLVVLADIDALLADLPDNPTDAEIDAALNGADVEVLVGTEPIAS